MSVLDTYSIFTIFTIKNVTTQDLYECDLSNCNDMVLRDIHFPCHARYSTLRFRASTLNSKSGHVLLLSFAV